MSFPETIKQEILWYLDNYWGVIATIANQRNDILFAGTIQDLDVPVQTNSLSDVASSKAIKLTELDLYQMMDWIKIINESYHYFQGNDKSKARLMWFSYLEKNPNRKSKTELMDNLFCSRNAYYAWLDDVIGIIGLKAASKKLIEI